MVSCATRIASNNLNNFFGNIFCVCKEWVQSWSLAFLLTNLKMSKNSRENEKEKKKKNGICKAFYIPRKCKKHTRDVIQFNSKEQDCESYNLGSGYKS